MRCLRFIFIVYSFTFIHCGVSAASIAQEIHTAEDAVILMYHNVASNTPPGTSVTPERFKQHMAYLADNGFTVWPLFKTLVYLATGKPIPAKTVVLTFDDAYLSVYTDAFPVLKAKGWPFTVFVTTKYITEGYTHFMNWEQIREMRLFGGDIGNHSLNHPHLIRRFSKESNKQWRERIKNEIRQAQAILHENVGYPVWAFAYPYGEYSAEVKKIVRELGYFGIGQHSGAVSSATDFQEVPRFPMATGFDGIENFKIKVSSKALPVTVLSPLDGLILKDTDVPVLTLRLEGGEYIKDRISCYASGQGRIQTQWRDKEKTVLYVRANEVIKPGRTKYNCTAPSLSGDNVFYWFSFLWMKPEADGHWYNE